MKGSVRGSVIRKLAIQWYCTKDNRECSRSKVSEARAEKERGIALDFKVKKMKQKFTKAAQ